MTPIDISGVEALPVVVVEFVELAPLGTVVEVPTRAEAMVVNERIKLVKVNVLVVSVVPVGVAVVGAVPVVEFVEPETDVEVGPGGPVVTISDLKLVDIPTSGKGSLQSKSQIVCGLKLSGNCPKQYSAVQSESSGFPVPFQAQTIPLRQRSQFIL